MDGAYSHDQVTRLLSRNHFDIRTLWQYVKPVVRQVEQDDGVLIADDIIQEKLYSDENDLIAWHFDHIFGRSVKGINLLNFVYHVGDVSLPVAYKLIEKPIQYTDLETKKVKRKAEKTKNEYFREMLKVCCNNQLQFKYVLADNWFSSNENMMYIRHDCNKHFVMACKPNRKVSLSEEGHTSDSVLSRFNKHAGLLPVFAKQIHTIDIDGEQYHWRPRASEIISGLSFGSVRMPSKKRKTEIKVATLKTANGCFVFKLGTKGLLLLDSNYSIPRLWHLAPLLGDIKLGFALNAKFDVDIGRNLLSISSPENRELFVVLGREFTHFLKQLFLRSQENWDAVRADWGFSDEVDVANFWGSFWRVLQEGISWPQDDFDSDIEVDSHAELIRQMFNAENGGILSFYESHKALPTGMKGSVPQSIAITTVTHRASELLTKISKHMAKLPLLQNYFREEKLVSDTIGRSLIDLGRLIPSLELEILLEKVLVDNYLSPQKAEQIHPVFNS